MMFIQSCCTGRAAWPVFPPLYFQIAVLSRKKILPKIMSVPWELISLPFFYGPVIIKKKSICVSRTGVEQEQKNCLLDFCANWLWFLSNFFYKSMYFVIRTGGVGWGSRENNNPVHILLAPVLFAFSAASLRLVGSVCTHHGHRPTTTCLWQTFLLFPFLIFFLIILEDNLVCQTLLIKQEKRM